MSRRADAIGIGLLKTASAASGAMRAGEAIAKGLKGAVTAASDFGAGAAKAVGANETAGRAAGILGGAAVAEGGRRKVKQKIDEIKYRQQFGY